MALAAAQSIDPHEAVRARVRERLASIRRSKTLWAADMPTFSQDALVFRPEDGVPRNLKLNSVQQKLHALIENLKAETGLVRIIILKARQMGVSTYVGARFYHRMRHTPGYRSVIMAHLDNSSHALSEMVRRYYENDPDVAKARVDNADELVLQNGSGIAVMTAGPVKTGAGRGFTFQLAHLSELAYWSNASDHMGGLLRAIPAVEGSEVIIESTANGTSGVFHSMALAARKGVGRYTLLFFPWFDHDSYAMEPPRGWAPGDAVREMAELHPLSREQLYWAEVTNTDMAVTDGEPIDELCWRFRQEYPSTVDEAFRAGRKGGYIKGSVVAAARQRLNPHQGDMPLIFGCDFATGGGGAASEYVRADQLSGQAADKQGQGIDDGDSNVFISHRGRVKGRELYERFKDRDTMSVANNLAGHIDRLGPDRVFMDKGGGGAQVYDILVARGYGRILELVDFGGKPVDGSKYRNKRAEMHGEFREWLQDGDIPDDEILESEITSVWVVREDENGLLLAPKREVRHRLKTSPDGLDACVLCHAAPVRPQGGAVGVGIGRGRR